MTNRTRPRSSAPNRRLASIARVVLTGIAAAGLALGAAGCQKKKTPPAQPPPPAPPPPAPEPITLLSMAQDAGADPRLQFASNVEIIDSTFAKSVINLGDAIAKGDAGKL